MDLSHIIIPQSIASWVGLICILLLWKAVGIWMTDRLRSHQMRRRIGNRSSDDTKLPAGSVGLEWYDRLIDAMNLNAEVNREVVTILQQIINKQDVILESFRLMQIQQKENNDCVRITSELIRQRLPEGA